MNSSSFPFKPSLHSGSKLADFARLYGDGKEKTGNMPAWVKSKVTTVDVVCGEACIAFCTILGWIPHGTEELYCGLGNLIIQAEMTNQTSIRPQE